MRKVIAEFLTTDPLSPSSYGDAGCMLTAINGPAMIVRHEKYEENLRHSIYLFARSPERGTQVFIEVFPMPDGRLEYEKELQFYLEQKRNFRLQDGHPFDSTVLCPVGSNQFESHIAFRTRDGSTRRRIVHSFVGDNRAVLLVYSLDDANFIGNPVLNYVSKHLSLSDLAISLVS